MNKQKIIREIAQSVGGSIAQDIITKSDFMPIIRGYLRPSRQDTELATRAEKAAAQAVEDVLMERPYGICPHCGDQLDSKAFDKGNGGDQDDAPDGGHYQNWSAVCPSCRQTSYAAYRFMGTYTEEEYKNIVNR